jgi:UDP-N-acetylmuramyl pentapeptide phosphotransferase/UDP-N-acetylglucosamine-1-phosphate transferase
MNYYYIVLLPFIILITNYLLIKTEKLNNLTGEKHQLFVADKNIPLSGGIIIIVFIFSFFLFNYNFQYLFFLSILFLGLLSDLRFLNSAKKRFFIQTIFIFVLVFFYEIYLANIGIYYLDFILKYKFISYLFFSFCLLIVVNGSNFIDGLNGLVIGYYLIVLVLILKLITFLEYDQFQILVINFSLLLTYLLIFNFSNKLYLGDSGSYFLGLFIGTLLIIIYKDFSAISSFYIVLLLWYPCFENLFSIIRKFRFNSSPLKADNKHLHQLLFYFIKKRFNLSKLLTNNLSSIIINSINLSFMFIGSNFIFDTKIQILLISCLVLLYLLSYYILFNFRYRVRN